MSRSPSISCAVLASVLAAASVVAQQPQPSTAAQSIGGGVTISAGMDAFGRDGGRTTPGLVLQAGYERRVGGAASPFAVRLAGDYWRTGSDFSTPRTDGAGSIGVRRTTTIAGGGLLGIVRLPTLGVFSPYALAGTGVQRYARRFQPDFVPLPQGGSASPASSLPPSLRETTLSFTGGVGAAARLRGVTLSAEARLTALPGLSALGVQSWRAPVTFGVRF